MRKYSQYLKTKKLWIPAALLVVYLSFFTVSETEFALVTQFGRPVAQYKEAGLKFKWPFQGVTRLDKRLHLYNPRPSEYLTRDKKNLLVENYVCWQVEDPLRFLRTVADKSSAEMRLHDIVWSQVSASLGKTPLSDLISTDTEHVRVGSLMKNVADECRSVARDRYGIQIASVDIKRLNLPAQNRESVFARMRAERERIAKQYRAEGEEEARKIRAGADRTAEEILSGAYKEAEIIRGKGDAEATRIYGKAFSRDPQFYQLVRTLEAYRKILDEKTTAVLSADSELLKLLTSGKNGKFVR
jgi:membrane protease subunit HflC